MRNFSRHRGPAPFLNASQLVQAHFGLTQRDLAALLGVSRAAVAMGERDGRNRRGLPMTALLRLSHLARALPPPEGVAPVPSVPAPKLSERERKALEMRLRVIAIEEYSVQKKRASCQTRLAQEALRQQALPDLRAAFPANDPRVQRELGYFEEDAAATLRDKAGTPALLALRLAVLAFEAGETRRLLGEGSNQIN